MNNKPNLKIMADETLAPEEDGEEESVEEQDEDEE